MTGRQYSNNKEESEKSIETYLRDRITQIGGLCLKYSNTQSTGYPDRLILLPGMPDIWVEVKSKGEVPTRLQQYRIKRLRELGRLVWIADSRISVEKLIREIRKCYNVTYGPEV